MDRKHQAREHRHSVFLSAQVERFGKFGLTEHRVRNISPRGACIDDAADFVRGQTLVVSIGALDSVGATVRWVTGTLAGFRFAQPVDIDAALVRTAIPPPFARATRILRKM